MHPLEFRKSCWNLCSDLPRYQRHTNANVFIVPSDLNVQTLLFRVKKLVVNIEGLVLNDMLDLGWMLLYCCQCRSCILAARGVKNPLITKSQTAFLFRL